MVIVGSHNMKQWLSIFMNVYGEYQKEVVKMDKQRFQNGISLIP